MSQTPNRAALLRHVEHLWGAWQSAGPAPGAVLRPGETLLPVATTQIHATYTQTGGALAIIGRRGSGKTTLLLHLLGDLLQDAHTSEVSPIPLFFPLRGEQTLAQMLHAAAERLYNIPDLMAQNNAYVLLLDDVTPAHDLAAFCAAHPRAKIVACSAQPAALAPLAHTLTMQALTDGQIQAYLNEDALRAHLEKDAVLRDLARVPFWLHAMQSAYRDFSVPLAVIDDPQARRDDLLRAYVERALDADASYPKHKTRQYLTWLAQTMNAQALDVFFIEVMQPDWLGNGQDAYVALRFQLTRWLDVLTQALFYGLLGGLLFGLVGALVGLLVGIFIGWRNATGWEAYANIQPAQPVRYLATWLPDYPQTPNAAIRHSALNALAVALPVMLLTGGISGVLLGLAGEAWASVGVGLWCGIIFGTDAGGAAALSHATLRRVLYRDGDAPFNYTRFLRYAVRIGLLRPVGGGFMFAHPALKAYFAARET